MKQATEEVQHQVEAAAAPKADLAGVKSYLLEQASELKTNTTALKEAGNKYYELAKAANFDYAALWQEKPDEVVKVIEEARAAWMAASPSYEQIEGLVAGVPAMAEYDLILDAGAAGSEDPEGAVPFDLTLPDGRVLSKPGNLFGVTESTLWGTYPEYTVGEVEADFNKDGKLDFGEALPEVNVLKAGVDELDRYTTELLITAEAWQPSESDGFTALVVMVPTMSEYFGSWKDSRFVQGDKSTQRDFVAISRLADIQGILGGLQVTYQGLSPMIKTVDPDQDIQIDQGLSDLKAFVADVQSQETGGKRFTPEEADLLGAEAQDRATAITGQIAQVAGQLNVEIQE
ncbi:MAG TPA: imelysin family protein [Anaerolineae bacterium]|nr:imelysin family protein [Anaerolineae bacterium]